MMSLITPTVAGTLPCLSDIICEQWHQDLLEFLSKNPFIHELTLLNHGQTSLDPRGTSIGKLMPDDCIIHAYGDGSRLTLQFIGEYHPHPELSSLWGLHGIRLKDFDLSGMSSVHLHLKEHGSGALREI